MVAYTARKKTKKMAKGGQEWTEYWKSMVIRFDKQKFVCYKNIERKGST